jgi:hypothetical protein
MQFTMIDPKRDQAKRAQPELTSALSSVRVTRESPDEVVLYLQAIFREVG